MNEMVLSLTSLANEIDNAKLSKEADVVDVISQNCLKIKTAQYVGIQGYWMRNNRCWANCYRQKRSSNPDMPAQEVWFGCLDEYGKAINNDDADWNKYADDLSQETIKIASQDKIASIYKDEEERFRLSIARKMKEGWSPGLAVCHSLESLPGRYSEKLIVEAEKLADVAQDLKDAGHDDLSKKASDAIDEIIKVSQLWGKKNPSTQLNEVLIRVYNEAKDVQAITYKFGNDPQAGPELKKRWDKWLSTVPNMVTQLQTVNQQLPNLNLEPVMGSLNKVVMSNNAVDLNQVITSVEVLQNQITFGQDPTQAQENVQSQQGRLQSQQQQLQQFLAQPQVAQQLQQFMGQQGNQQTAVSEDDLYKLAQLYDKQRRTPFGWARDMWNRGKDGYSEQKVMDEVKERLNAISVKARNMFGITRQYKTNPALGPQIEKAYAEWRPLLVGEVKDLKELNDQISHDLSPVIKNLDALYRKGSPNSLLAAIQSTEALQGQIEFDQGETTDTTGADAPNPEAPAATTPGMANVPPQLDSTTGMEADAVNKGVLSPTEVSPAALQPGAADQPLPEPLPDPTAPEATAPAATAPEATAPPAPAAPAVDFVQSVVEALSAGQISNEQIAQLQSAITTSNNKRRGEMVREQKATAPTQDDIAETDYSYQDRGYQDYGQGMENAAANKLLNKIKKGF